jgi:hypothetical protein
VAASDEMRDRDAKSADKPMCFAIRGMSLRKPKPNQANPKPRDAVLRSGAEHFKKQ